MVPRSRASRARGARGPREGQAQHPAARREAQGLVRAGAHEGSEDSGCSSSTRTASSRTDGCHRAEPLGAVRRRGRGPEGRARAPHARRAARARGQARADAATLAPMLAEIGDAPFNRADWMWEPKLDGYRVLAFIDERRRAAALAARPRARRRISRGSSPELASRRVDGMILDGEIVAFDAGGKPSFGALQDRAQLKTDARDRRRRPGARRSSSSASTCSTSPASTCAGAVSRPPALSRAMPAALAARAARARRGRRRRAARGGARERLRRRGRQAQGQPLRSGQALGVVAQGQADAERRFRRRRLHAAARARARRSARCSSATGTTASCATPRTWARASTTARSRRCKARLEPLQRTTLPVRREARAERADDLGRARSWSPR